MTKEVGNNKTKVPKGMELNDKDYGNSLLSCLKELEKNYTVALTEASNDTLYDELFATFQQISELQRETYNLLFQNGWYQLEEADQTKIDKKLKMLSQECKDLNE